MSLVTHDTLLTIYIDRRPQSIITADGSHMTVCGMHVRDAEGLCNLRDCEIFPTLSEVKFVIQNRPFFKKLHLPPDLKTAIVSFLQSKHAKQDIKFDCYTFANSVKGIEPHKITYMLRYWETSPNPKKISAGVIVFFTSGRNSFHHAAIYLGVDLFISVYGAGGDLEVSRLEDMKRDFQAKHILVASPVNHGEKHVITNK
jgi:hypothetical protein